MINDAFDSNTPNNDFELRILLFSETKVLITIYF